MSLFKRKENNKPLYDIDKEIPVIRASICTGEKVAGFKNKTTGAFREVLLIRNNNDLEAFCAKYGINNKDLPIIY